MVTTFISIRWSKINTVWGRLIIENCSSCFVCRGNRNNNRNCNDKRIFSVLFEGTRFNFLIATAGTMDVARDKLLMYKWNENPNLFNIKFVWIHYTIFFPRNLFNCTRKPSLWGLIGRFRFNRIRKFSG